MMRHLLAFAFAFCSLPVTAAQVAKVKGKTALIQMQGESTQAGDVYYAVNAEGKKKALIKISRIKGDKAIGKVIKGAAKVGMSLSPRGAGAHASKSSGTSFSNAPTTGTRAYWGGLLGFGMDTMNVTVNSSTAPFASLGTVPMSGNGFSGKALFDYELFPQIWFRGTSGIEQINVAGAPKCGAGNKQTCDAQLMYATLDLLGRYVFTTGGIRPWLGGGIGLLFPASKSSTALKASSIGTTNVMIVAGGVDWFISPKMYIPLSVEYGLLPKSDEVEANLITLRAGLAVPF